MPAFRRFLDGVVECNLLSPFPNECKTRDLESRECKYCKFNHLNYDEGRFFTSFMEERRYNPIKDTWTDFEYNKKTCIFEKRR